MSRAILIYGQSGAGKTYSLKNLDPEKTFIVDADLKGDLCWLGAQKVYNKNNFYSNDELDRILNAIHAMSTEKYAHVNTLVIDGITNAFANFLVYYDDLHKPKNAFEKYQVLYSKAMRIFRDIKLQRDDLFVVLIGNVELGDPYQANSVDRLRVPGQAFKNSEPENRFNYVLYAKKIDDEYIFETQANHSTAKTPEGLFPDVIPNDLAYVINTIKGGDTNG